MLYSPNWIDKPNFSHSFTFHHCKPRQHIVPIEDNDCVDLFRVQRIPLIAMSKRGRQLIYDPKTQPWPHRRMIQLPQYEPCYFQLSVMLEMKALWSLLFGWAIYPSVYYSSPYKSAQTVLLRPESPTKHFSYGFSCWFACVIHPSQLRHTDQTRCNQVTKKVKKTKQQTKDLHSMLTRPVRS